LWRDRCPIVPEECPFAAIFEANVDELMTRGMSYDIDDSTIEFARLRSRRRHAERMSISQEVLPAINMIIGEWYVDELGVRTREITAREQPFVVGRLGKRRGVTEGEDEDRCTVSAGRHGRRRRVGVHEQRLQEEPA
jgi:hypothetical protein